MVRLSKINLKMSEFTMFNFKEKHLFKKRPLKKLKESRKIHEK